MVKFGEIERIFFSEINPVLPLPPIVAPLASPFPTDLPSGGAVNLALVNVRTDHDRDGVLLSAVVNWSATFTPAAATTLNAPGFADVTFELLRNGIVIYRVNQTIEQKGFPLVQTIQFTTATSSFQIASLLYFDFIPTICRNQFHVYTLRATNIALTNPQVPAGSTATTTAAAGAVTLVAEKTEACRTDSV